MKNNIINLFKGIGTIFLYFLIAAIYGSFFSKFYNSSNIGIAYISQIGLYLCLLLIIGLIYHKCLINDFKTFKKQYINVAIKNWIIGLCFMIISNLIITIILKDISSNESMNRALLTAYPLSNIINMVILGPLIEELVFRASFKEAFKKWYTFALVTALLFGLAHIATFTWTELLFLIPYGALGFFFAKSFYETNNIYTSYITHLIHNGFTIFTILVLMKV